jgi:hypothetical protein
MAFVSLRQVLDQAAEHCDGVPAAPVVCRGGPFLSEGVLNGFDVDDQLGSDVSDNLTPAIELINKFN